MDESGNSRRRRGAGVVTPNACTECRKKRSKCDGQTPCSRCVSQNTECLYEVPVRQSKETMRTEIEQLQNHRRHSERVLSALASNTLYQETFNRIRNGESMDSIAEWLKECASNPGSATPLSDNITSYSSSMLRDAISSTLKMAEGVANHTYQVSGGLYSPSNLPSVPSSSEQQTWVPWQSEGSHKGDDAMNWTSNQPQGQGQMSTSPLVGQWPQSSEVTDDDNSRMANGSGKDRILGPAYQASDGSSRSEAAVANWTNVTSNNEFVEHLMALYFCWEYPTFASLSKEHFLTDFRGGQSRFCSSLLVNAMLALGCRFTNLPEAQADPGRRETAGDHFFAEAKTLLYEDDHTSLTTIQALGLMSIREASCGRVTESHFYAGQAIRLAVEFGLHFETSEEERAEDETMHEVRSATFWGAFALDEAWSLAVGRIPHCSRAAKLVVKPAIIDVIESGEWVPYTDQGAPEITAANQPSNVRSVYKCFCELSELVHHALYTLYTPGRHLTSSEMLTIYTRYLNWYSSLPEALRLGHNFTPAVLFAHLYYHFAILLLFRPFIKLRFIGSSVLPRDVALQAADAITTLVRSYSQLYTLKRTPSFVPYIVLAAAIMHLAASDVEDPKQILQGASDLRELDDTHNFSSRGLDIIRFLASEWEMENILDEDNPPSAKQLRDICSPVTTSLNLFSPSMNSSTLRGNPRSSMVLFAPFPMQGSPLIASDDKQLERDGFARV